MHAVMKEATFGRPCHVHKGLVHVGIGICRCRANCRSLSIDFRHDRTILRGAGMGGTPPRKWSLQIDCGPTRPGPLMQLLDCFSKDKLAAGWHH